MYRILKSIEDVGYVTPPPTTHPPLDIGTIAIGQEDSGTIDRGFSLGESLHWPWDLYAQTLLPRLG